MREGFYGPGLAVSVPDPRLPPHPCVLIVEDDHALCRLYGSALRLAGLDLETAHNGWAALESVEARRPDVIVLDLNLPMLDGAAVFREIRGNPRTSKIPILIVTGVDAALLGSVDDSEVRILRKPLAPDVLAREVDRLMTSRRTRARSGDDLPG